MQKAATWASVFSGLVFLGFVGVAAAGRDAPGVIYMDVGPRTEPVWISAEEAAAPEETGGLRWQFFSESDQGNLRRFMAENERLKGEQKSREARGSDLDCPIFLSTPDQDRIDPKPNRSFSDLAEQALAIYSGQIESVSQGFFDGLPSSLLQVKVTEVFRSSDLVAREEVFIPYPFARFKVGASTYCGGSAAMYRPATGDQVLVFIYDPPLNAARTLVYPRSPELLLQSAAGRLVVPEPLKTDTEIAVAGSLESLEKLLRRSVKKRHSEDDLIWSYLRLWVDRNHDGISQRREITRLRLYDIVAIDLDFSKVDEMDGNGNSHPLQGPYLKRLTDRRLGSRLVPYAVHDVFFKISDISDN